MVEGTTASTRIIWNALAVPEGLEQYILEGIVTSRALHTQNWFSIQRSSGVKITIKLASGSGITPVGGDSSDETSKQA
jgi:hypothetical protein